MRAWAIKGPDGNLHEFGTKSSQAWGNFCDCSLIEKYENKGYRCVEVEIREPGATDSSSPVATGAPSGQHSGSQPALHPICPPNKCINPDANGMPCDGVRKICIHAQQAAPPAQAGSGMVAMSADMLKKLSGTADDRYEALDYLRGMLAAAERAP